MVTTRPHASDLVGIIGRPVGHSISPQFQQAAFDHLGLRVRYERWDTPPDFLAPRVLELRRHGILGANVTVPHKEAVMKLLDEVDEVARAIGAVNTIVNRHGRLAGHNTDAPGFRRALARDAGFDAKGKRAVVLGAGGAARAVVYALLQGGAAAVTVSNRTAARAETLAEWARGLQGSARVDALPWGSPLGAADLVVNTTTVGMKGSAEEGRSPLAPSSIGPSMLVCDLVYNPQDTPLLAAARRAGARTLPGLPMLIYQGAISFELWTAREPPLEVMFAAARAALGNQGT